MFGNQDREKGWRSPARAGKSKSSPTSTAMRQPKPHPPGNHGPSQRRVPLPQLVRAHASYAIPASQLSRGRRIARGHLPCTCQQAGEESQSRCASRRGVSTAPESGTRATVRDAGGCQWLRVRARAGRQGCSGDTVGCSPQRTMTCDEMRAFSKEHSHLDFPCARPIANMQWCNGVR